MFSSPEIFQDIVPRGT